MLTIEQELNYIRQMNEILKVCQNYSSLYKTIGDLLDRRAYDLEECLLIQRSDHELRRMVALKTAEAVQKYLGLKDIVINHLRGTVIIGKADVRLYMENMPIFEIVAYDNKPIQSRYTFHSVISFMDILTRLEKGFPHV